MSDAHFADLTCRVREFIRAHDGWVALPVEADPVTFESLAREVFAAQFDGVPPYRAFCRARGITPATLGDWRDIPAVPTAAFQELDFTSLAPAERAGVFFSSGTTGQARSRHFHSPDSLALYGESLRAWFQPHLLPEVTRASVPALAGGSPAGVSVQNTWRFLSLAPPAAEVPHSSLAHMFTHLAERWGGSEPVFLARGDAGGQWHLDAERAWEALAEAAQGHTPAVLLGTAFLFVHLLDRSGFLADSLAGHVTLPPGSRVLETGGYKGRSRAVSRSDLHAAITRGLGVPASHIVSEYGMSELSSQAYDHVVPALSGPGGPDHPAAPTGTRHFRFPPWARARVMSPEDGHEVGEGEAGLLQVMDLANVRSVMAVQTEDLVVRRDDGFELLGRLPRAEARGCSLLAT